MRSTTFCASRGGPGSSEVPLRLRPSGALGNAMEALGHRPKEPAAPNLPATAQVHAGSPDSPSDASPHPGVPHLVALLARTARDHPRIVHARSRVESFAQGQ